MAVLGHGLEDTIGLSRLVLALTVAVWVAVTFVVRMNMALKKVMYPVWLRKGEEEHESRR